MFVITIVWNKWQQNHITIVVFNCWLCRQRLTRIFWRSLILAAATLTLIITTAFTLSLTLGLAATRHDIVMKLNYLQHFSRTRHCCKKLLHCIFLIRSLHSLLMSTSKICWKGNIVHVSFYILAYKTYLHQNIVWYRNKYHNGVLAAFWLYCTSACNLAAVLVINIFCVLN